MPFMYSRRALVNTYYPREDKRSGVVTTLSSSIMNEQITSEAQTPKDEKTKP